MGGKFAAQYLETSLLISGEHVTTVKVFYCFKALLGKKFHAQNLATVRLKIFHRFNALLGGKLLAQHLAVVK